MNTRLLQALAPVGLLGVLWLGGCTAPDGEPGTTAADTADATPAAAPHALSDADAALANELGLDPARLARLIDTPLYAFSEGDVHDYLRYLDRREPDLRRRVAHLARKNLGQPYEIYLLGEMPFETIDPQPIYCLDRSDCVVFIEHTYAMALSRDWPSFIRLLQRIRYKAGHISVTSRNHYTEADWNPANAWLVEDITAAAGGDAAATYTQRVDRAGFFAKRYGLDRDIPVETIEETYVPFEAIGQAKPHLRTGDCVNVVRGTSGGKWVGHIGLIVLGDNGAVNIIHSAAPEVREEPIDAYIARSTRNLAQRDAAGKSRLFGFKFLRLRDDPLARLAAIDGPAAPRVTLPGGAPAPLGAALGD